jgi:hypothetical protein
METPHEEPVLTPTKKKDTYHITYGIALIVLTLMLNVLALDVITGKFLFSSTQAVPTENYVVPMSDTMVPSVAKKTASSSEQVSTSTLKAP